MNDDEEIIQIKKTDLHIHLGGSFPLDFIREIATPSEFADLEAHLAKVASKHDTDYHGLFDSFSLVARLVNSLSKIEQGTLALCAQLASHGVAYAELRTGLKDFGEGREEYLLAVLRGVRTARLAHPALRVALVLSLKRNATEELAQDTLRLLLKHRESGVVGLDVSDDALLESAGGLRSILPLLREHRVPVLLHLGECKEETEAQQMQELEALNPCRIGHGVFLSPAARAWVLQRRLPVEMCLSSAVMAHMVQDASEHPALQLLREGYPVAVCTDDPLIFSTNHLVENKMLLGLLGISIEELAQIHQRSFEFALS